MSKIMNLHITQPMHMIASIKHETLNISVIKHHKMSTFYASNNHILIKNFYN